MRYFNWYFIFLEISKCRLNIKMCTGHRPRQWTFWDVLGSKRTAQRDSDSKGWYHCL